MCLNSVRVAENSSSQILTWASIEPPMSRNSSTLTVFLRSGCILMSSMPPLWAVERMVLSMSNSSSLPVRANLRSLRKAILMLRVPSSTESSRFLYWRSSQTFLAFFFLPLPMPPGPLRPLWLGSSPSSPSWPSLPCLACSASACSLASRKASISFSRPPRDSIFFRSSGVSDFSNSRRSHSSGMSDSSMPCRSSRPRK